MITKVQFSINSAIFNHLLWGRYGYRIRQSPSHTISLDNFICTVIADLLLTSYNRMDQYQAIKCTDPISSVVERFQTKHLPTAVFDKDLSKDLFDHVVEMAELATRIPFSLITNAVVQWEFMKPKSKKRHVFYETTLELLQHVPVKMIKALPRNDASGVLSQ